MLRESNDLDGISCVHSVGEGPIGKLLLFKGEGGAVGGIGDDDAGERLAGEGGRDGERHAVTVDGGGSNLNAVDGNLLGICIQQRETCSL